ncbi:MAG: NGG1p interacting factor NIF3 [Candidatus Omnitrophica bacterium]|nr:NGG1p interacting factor NIF3 [Candidatus Omnitrophota bacterium]MBU1870266.1 NGG1p interacting factor NIF3 [Candidatus Omnitrophota bacterium]
MRLDEFYKLVVKLGGQMDPRKNKFIASYPDTAILYGKADTQVNKLLVGIDIEVPELLLAERIREREGLDLVIGHHPEGRAFASLAKVMQVQVDILKQAGVDLNLAQKLLDERMQEVGRRLLSANHTRPVDAARLLDMPFMCMHTPADNHVFDYLTQLMNKKKPKKVCDIVDILSDIPEYRNAEQISVGPRLILGNPNCRVGKILFEMTGGTEGSKDVFGKLYKAGVRTLVSMHLSEEHFKKVKDANLNVVIAGHISSDTLGLNLLLDGIEKKAKEKFHVISCSGFQRISRN